MMGGFCLERLVIEPQPLGSALQRLELVLSSLVGISL